VISFWLRAHSSGAGQIHVEAVQKTGIAEHFFGALARVSQSAVLDQCNVRSDGQSFAKLVGRDDDGCAALTRFEQKVAQHGYGAVIERSEWFIEQKDAR